MSTEAPAPKPTETPKDKLDTSLHPEGLRPFKHGDLGDVADELTVPTDASAIDPTTHEVTFDKIPLKRPEAAPAPEAIPAPKTRERGRGRRVLIGAGLGVAGLLATGLAVFATNAGDKDRPAVDETSQSSDPSQSPETGAPSAETGAELVGKPSVAFETLNINAAPVAEVSPSPDLESLKSDFDAAVQEAYNPVMTDSPQEALQLLWNAYSVRMLSGQIDPSTGLETDASVARREQLDKVLFTDGVHPGTAAEVENENTLRELIALDTYFLYVNGQVKNDAPTYREDLERNGEPTKDRNSFKFNVTVHIATSLGNEGLSSDLRDNFIDLGVTEKPGTVTITRAKDGSWGVSDLNIG